MNKKAQRFMEYTQTYGLAILLAMIAIGILAYFGVFTSNPQIESSEDFCNNNGGNWTSDGELCCLRFNAQNHTVDRDNFSCYKMEEINGTYFFTRNISNEQVK